MALLEIVQRKLRDQNALQKIIRALPWLCFLIPIISIIMMIELSMTGEYRHTYFSENALMPGQAHSYFRESEWNFVRGYRNEIVNMMNDNITTKNDNLNKLLIEMGYKTNLVQFMDEETGTEKNILYAIYHAPKGDDTEAMVLATPWYSEFEGESKLNVGGLSLSIGLARYLRRLSIWAKNVILVFPEDGEQSLRYWVNAYHTTLENTAGSLECAIVVDCPSSGDYIGYIDLEYAGINGQLPNLDLINTAIHIAENEGIRVSVNNTPFGQLWTNDFYSRVTSLFSGLFSIASSGILEYGDNKSFSGWNVQAIKLRGVEGHNSDITSFGRVIESTLRSVNNLLEKFHQSFFFYLLLGAKNFVSVGMYLPYGAMISIAYILASLNSLVDGFNASAGNNYKDFNIEVVKKKFTFKFVPMICSIITFLIITSTFIAYGLYTSNIITRERIQFDYQNLTYNYFVIPSMALIFIGTFIISPLLNILNIRIHSDFSRSLTMICMFFMGYALFGMMILNFSLSYVIGICFSAIFSIRYSTKSNFKLRFKNCLVLLLTCPATWLMIFGLLHKFNAHLDSLRNLIQYFTMPLLEREIQKVLDFLDETSLNELLEGPVDIFTGLLKSYTRVQCWTWLYVSFIWIPLWVCMLLVSILPVYTGDLIKQSKKNV